jgi:hypothetical protein
MTQLTINKAELTTIETTLSRENQTFIPEQDLRKLHNRIAELRQEIYNEIKKSVQSVTKYLTGISIYAIHNFVPDFKILDKSAQTKLCQELGFQLEDGGNLQRGPKIRIGFGQTNPK